MSKIGTGVSEIGTGVSKVGAGMSKVGAGMSEIGAGVSEMSTAANERDAGLTEVDVSFASQGFTLAGVVTRPSASEAGPAVLLISGSGPIDRDGSHKRLRLDITRQIAVALRHAGIASLRYDKRGAGASRGDFLATGLHDNVADARAAFETLRAQPGVDPERVFVLGHSEGAIITVAMLADGAPAAGGILLSPTARPGADVLRWQAEQVAGDLPPAVRFLLRLFRVDLVAKVARNHEKLRATTTDVARLGGARVNARWFREFMTYDPATDLDRIKVPVLAVAGGKDLQAPPGDLAVIRDRLGDRATTVLVDDLSHILRSQPGPATLRSYRRDVIRPVDSRVLSAILEWVAAHSR
ncbi:alpha/beta fold hydrolase [Actinoplanes sp. NPDC024001]|uniref:alpha/beta hydrolase family protein n=1 Tax=Actinoplanes sp. NPDC024001 TaxID=3154598 RepID=UPI0033C6B4D7